MRNEPPKVPPPMRCADCKSHIHNSKDWKHVSAKLICPDEPLVKKLIVCPQCFRRLGRLSAIAMNDELIRINDNKNAALRAENRRLRE